MSSGASTIFDGMAKFKKDILALKSKSVMVGIPDDNDSRNEGKPYGNAQIAYVQTNGSDLHNIPPRPFVEPGVEGIQEELATDLRDAARQVLSHGPGVLETAYEKVGIKGQNAVKRYLTDSSHFQGISDATKAARKRAGFLGTKPLIWTAQMLNAVTYVVRGKRG